MRVALVLFVCFDFLPFVGFLVVWVFLFFFGGVVVVLFCLAFLFVLISDHLKFHF